MDNNLALLDSDDDYDWEEVEVSTDQHKTIEITISAQPKAEESKKSAPLSSSCCTC
jgi:hypothetical protein